MLSHDCFANEGLHSITEIANIVGFILRVEWLKFAWSDIWLNIDQSGVSLQSVKLYTVMSKLVDQTFIDNNKQNWCISARPDDNIFR